MWQRKAEAEAAALEGERREWRDVREEMCATLHDRETQHSARVQEMETSLAGVQVRTQTRGACLKPLCPTPRPRSHGKPIKS